MGDPRDAKLAEMGEIIARQQTLLLQQQELIQELQRRLADRESEFAARTTKLEAEVKRLERELLGPKTEKLKVRIRCMSPVVFRIAGDAQSAGHVDRIEMGCTRRRMARERAERGRVLRWQGFHGGWASALVEPSRT